MDPHSIAPLLRELIKSELRVALGVAPPPEASHAPKARRDSWASDEEAAASGGGSSGTPAIPATLATLATLATPATPATVWTTVPKPKPKPSKPQAGFKPIFTAHLEGDRGDFVPFEGVAFVPNALVASPKGLYVSLGAIVEDDGNIPDVVTTTVNFVLVRVDKSEEETPRFFFQPLPRGCTGLKKTGAIAWQASSPE